MVASARTHTFALCLAVCVICAPGRRLGAQDRRQIAAIDIAGGATFHIKYKGFDAQQKSGELPAYWSGNMWDAGSTGEIFVDAAPVHGARALGLRNLEGKGAIQMYNWQAFDLPAGHRYRVSAEVWVEPDTVGALSLHGENIVEQKVSLRDTGGKWAVIKQTLEQSRPGKLALQLQNYAVGAERVIYVRALRVEDTGETVAEAPPPAPLQAITANETNALPDLDAASIADPYYSSLARELSPLHPKRLLLAPDPTTTLRQLHFVTLDEGRATAEEAPVSGQRFDRALRITTEKKKAEWQTHIQGFFKAPVHRGDVLYCTLMVRALNIQDGRDHGQGRLYADERPNGSDQGAQSLYAGDFAVPRDWTRIHLPMIATQDFAPNGEIKLMFTFGHTAQTVEVGGVALFDFGAGLDRLKLPHAELPVDYPGREPNALWRQQALARIEQIRKGNLAVLVLDHQGRPVRNATVAVEMKRHAFLWGASTPIGMLPGQHVKPWNDDFKRTAGASDADKQRMQETFLKLFNATTSSPTWTLWYGGDARISQDDILAGLKWFKENHIAVLNSQVVYPSSEFTPADVVKNLLQDKAHSDEFRQALHNWITEHNTKLGPYLASVQIANEIEGRPQYTDVLGHESVVDWFRWSQEANPQVAREINGPYDLGQQTIQTANRPDEWPRTDGLQYYYDLITWLLKRGAPIQYIGFQNHAGIGAPPPAAVLRSLDDFARFGLPLEVTEFEVTLQNGSDTRQRSYQADYVRDFLIAVFSHPATHALILQDFWQPGAWQYEGASCFYNADWSLNPHGKVYIDLVLNRWWTRAMGKTGAQGAYATRGFLGDYEVKVTAPNGKTRTVAVSLPRAGRKLVVRLD